MSAATARMVGDHGLLPGHQREADEEATRTLLDLLTTDKMDGSDSSSTGAPLPPTPRTTRWTALKQRLGLKGIICCGGGWALHHNRSSSSAMLPADDDDDETGNDVVEVELPDASGDGSSEREAPAGMDLGTALAEERRLRLGEETAASASKVSLIRLMAEGEVGSDGVCCVCMERSKGAAFIPCGHTFCRVCTRELWLDRGSCPLCNRPILEILDIF